MAIRKLIYDPWILALVFCSWQAASICGSNNICSTTATAGPQSCWQLISDHTMGHAAYA